MLVQVVVDNVFDVVFDNDNGHMIPMVVAVVVWRDLLLVVEEDKPTQDKSPI